MPVRDLREEKNALRKRYRSIRRGYSESFKAGLDELVYKRVTGLYQYRNAELVLSYVSKDIETDTLKLIERAWSDGKRVAVPRCIDGTRLMQFYYITSFDQLEKSSFGVMEPIEELCEKLAEAPENSLCIVPGMAFDSQGYRLGYGKGYYDRFLSDYKGVKVGVCYSDCIKWTLPRGKYDKPVDILITDRFFRVIHQKNRNAVSDAAKLPNKRRSFSDE